MEFPAARDGLAFVRVTGRVVSVGKCFFNVVVLKNSI